MNEFLSIIHTDLNRSNPKYGEPRLHPDKMKDASFKISLEFLFHRSFLGMLKVTGQLIQAIALKSNTLYANDFGTLRIPGNSYHRISTPLIGEYKSMIDPLLQIDPFDPSMNWEYYEEGINCTGSRIGFDQNSPPINLSRYLVDSNGKSTIAHTSPENLERALQQCDFLYKQIVGFHTRKEYGRFDECRARIHWWIVQAAPFFKGTAMAGEMIASGMTFSFYGKLIQWKEGVLPDQMALVSSEEDFVAFYPQLYKLISG